MLGALPFALLGIALGYWASPRGALPVANILYLVLAFAGGLWTTPAHLPGAVASVSPLVPTRQFGNVLWGAAEGRLWRPRDWLLLAGVERGRSRLWRPGATDATKGGAMAEHAP